MLRGEPWLDAVAATGGTRSCSPSRGHHGSHRGRSSYRRPRFSLIRRLVIERAWSLSDRRRRRADRVLAGEPQLCFAHQVICYACSLVCSSPPFRAGAAQSIASRLQWRSGGTDDGDISSHFRSRDRCAVQAVAGTKRSFGPTVQAIRSAPWTIRLCRAVLTELAPDGRRLALGALGRNQ